MADYDHNQTIEDALAEIERGDVDAAVPLAERAVKMRADDAESWSVLGLCLHRHAERKDEAVAALEKAVVMEPKEPRWRLHLGTALLHLGRAKDGESILAEAAELSGGHPHIMSAWGGALMAVGRPADAAQVYGRVLQTTPSPDIWIKAGDALLAARDTVNAVHAYERAYHAASRPQNVTAGLADMYITLGQYDQARTMNARLLADNPLDAEAGLRAANLDRWDGDFDAVKARLTALWATHPDHPRICAAMVGYGDAAATRRAKTLLKDAAISRDDRRHIGFALTRWADKTGDIDAAWDYATQANALYDDSDNDGPDDGLSALEAMLRSALRAYALIPDGEPSTPDMIYVIGPPRSGGTLLQTVLSRMDDTRSVGERGALMAWLPQMLDDPAKLASMVEDLRRADIAGMAKAVGEAARYVDKTPHHVFVAGLLSKVHASAKFIAPERDAADMAVSLYFHEFGPEFAFTRDIKAIKAYLALHAKAVRAWQKAGVIITPHDHDAFTADPAQRGEALLAALNLPWSEDLLQDSVHDAPIRTFSATQVRGGISQKFAGRGARYAEKLKAAGFDG